MRNALALHAGLALLAACADTPPATGAKRAAWHDVLQNMQPTFLSVWGTSSKDVFVVGGSRGNGGPSAMMHYDGQVWKDLVPGGTDTFWWVDGTSSHDVWAVGENGRITHWDGASFTEHVSGTTATLYGVWSASPGDAWAVGGTPEGGSTKPNDVILHFDGQTWAPSLPAQAFGRAFFKVWGTGPDNLYVVGEAGTIWHRTATGWLLESQAGIATGTLTTVTGCSAHEIYAVGGRNVLRSDGSTWTRDTVSAALTNEANGVACASPGNAVIVGFGGLKMRNVSGQWSDDLAAPPYADLHAAWADESGAYWAVGGDFVTAPRAGAARGGVVGHYGDTAPSARIAH
ncbi:MAG: hypothetical protein M3O36_17580 [Myxococcota bacterium]|nr:hypothetical protein [Myxococcota bacterium]